MTRGNVPTGCYPLGFDPLTRNQKQLESFAAYCKVHPEERFWQALRNWAQVNFVYTSRIPIEDTEAKDTFYWEGRFWGGSGLSE